MVIRLNTDKRQRLLSHAALVTVCPDEQREENRAHKILLDLVLRELPKLWPVKHMQVLRMYGATDQVRMLAMHDPRIPDPSKYRSGRYRRELLGWIEFPLYPRDTTRIALEALGIYDDHNHLPSGPYVEVPYGYTDSLGRGVTGILLNPRDSEKNTARYEIFAALRSKFGPPAIVWETAAREHDKARKSILRDIRTAVYHSTTLEGLAKLWSPAMLLAEEFGAPPKIDEELKVRLSRAKWVNPKPPEE